MSEQLDKEMEELEELEEVTANAKTISANPSSEKLKQEKEDMQKAKTSSQKLVPQVGVKQPHPAPSVKTTVHGPWIKGLFLKD